MKRPLTGEPLAVDLVNTRWRTPTGEADLLAELGGAAAWLAERGLDTPATEPVRAALLTARDALRSAFDHQPGAESDLNAILSRAVIVRQVVDGRVSERHLFADESWRPAWLAVDDYLALRGSDGSPSVRRCEGADCVLYFHDPSGRRRWCDMASCGNRAKAQRHYARTRTAASAD